MPVYHPMFVHFPIALVSLAVILDAISYFAKNERLRTAGWWALVAGALGGIATVVTGWLDMNAIPIHARADRFVGFHMTVGLTILGAVVVLLIWRGVVFFKNLPLRFPYVLSALLVLCLILFQNWLGGELVYSYGVGVAPTGQSRVTSDQAEIPLNKVEKIFGPFEVSHPVKGEKEKPSTDKAAPEIPDDIR